MVSIYSSQAPPANHAPPPSSLVVQNGSTQTVPQAASSQPPPGIALVPTASLPSSLKRTPFVADEDESQDIWNTFNVSTVISPSPDVMVAPPGADGHVYVITGGRTNGILHKIELLEGLQLEPGLVFHVCKDWEEGLRVYKGEYYSGRVSITPDPPFLSVSPAPSAEIPSQEASGIISGGASPQYIPSTAPTPDLPAARKRALELAQAAARAKKAKARRAARMATIKEVEPSPSIGLKGGFAPVDPKLFDPPPPASQSAILTTIDTWMASEGLRNLKTGQAVSVSSDDSDDAKDDPDYTTSSDSDAFDVSPGSKLKPQPFPLRHRLPKSAKTPDVFSAGNAPFTQTSAGPSASAASGDSTGGRRFVKIYMDEGVGQAMRRVIAATTQPQKFIEPSPLKEAFNLDMPTGSARKKIRTIGPDRPANVDRGGSAPPELLYSRKGKGKAVQSDKTSKKPGRVIPSSKSTNT